jgi:purine-cytosine permease-like protein
MADAALGESVENKGAKGHSRIGKLWTAAVCVAAIAVGALTGQVWLPLGFGLAALTGAALGGITEAAVGVLGTAIGVPVLRSVLSTVIHSPLYAIPVALGMASGLLARHAITTRLR